MRYYVLCLVLGWDTMFFGVNFLFKICLENEDFFMLLFVEFGY